MFSKFHSNQNKYLFNRQPPTYSQKSKLKAKIKQKSYSRIHLNRKAISHQLLDYHIVSNDSYTYQGEWQGSFRSGEGIVFFKNGTMIIGHWRKDLLDGRALIVTKFGALITAQFINGKLNGWVLAQYKNKLIVANLYFQDKLDGPRISFEGTQQLWIASNFTNNGNLQKIIKVEKGKRNHLPTFVQNDQLYQLFEQVIIKKNYTYDFYKIRTITVGGGRYMGFLNAEDVPSGLGITYSENECFIGNFNDGFLDKFGRMIFQNGDIYHGGFSHGQFFSHGIYHNFLQNKTMVINSIPDQQNQIIQQKKGYYLVDFEVKIGEAISKQDQINFTQSMKNFMKILEQYYHQYHIQSKLKQEFNFSNQSQDPHNTTRMKDILELDQNTYIIKPIKWIQGNENSVGMSQQVQQENLKNQFLKAQMHKKSFQITNQKRFFSPKNQNARSNQFFSVLVKQNEQINEKQKHNKQNPKNIETKKQMFYSDYNQLASKSVDVNALTFRGNKNKNQNDNNNSNNKDQKDNRNDKLEKNQKKQEDEKYEDFQQFGRNKMQNYMQPLVSRKSSEISNIDLKITGIMKKSALRRRIFQ